LSTETLSSILDGYHTYFTKAYSDVLLPKLGFAQFKPEDQTLVDDLFSLLNQDKVDYTIFYRALSRFSIEGENTTLQDLFIDRLKWQAWAQRYNARLRQENINEDDRQQRMLKNNPKYILRKHLAQTAISKAQQGDFSEVDTLLALLQRPFDEQPDKEHYAAPPPDWAANIHLSCSS
jgi:uncharacterized protein YdiU (UPF0061 family)